MDSAVGDTTYAPVEILTPAERAAPMVFSSPHSGRDYPASFLAQSPLDPVTLRRSEDSFVDEIFAAAPRCGAPLLKALFPRAYCDPNREPFELDPSMFAGRLPDFVNTRSRRVAAGLGTIARVVASGAEIYDRKLRFDEALARIEMNYRPYHAALTALIAETRRHFGTCVLIECHSMPSIGGPMEDDAGKRRRVDIILGDGHGNSCAPGPDRPRRSPARRAGLSGNPQRAPTPAASLRATMAGRAAACTRCRSRSTAPSIWTSAVSSGAPSMRQLTESFTAVIEGLCDAGPQVLAA